MKQLNDHIKETNFDKALELLEIGIDINEKYGIGIRPIIAAINSGNPKIVDFVVNYGANVNIDEGNPLNVAIDIAIDGMIQDEKSCPSKESMEIIKILIEHKADLELRDSNGKRPIDMITAYSQNESQLNLLKSFFRPIIPNVDKLKINR